MPAAAMIRSTSSITSGGGVRALHAQVVLRRVGRAGGAIEFDAVADWQMSAGHRLKFSPVLKTLMA